MTGVAILAAMLGGLLGFGADRLAARWPVHQDGGVRGLDWRTVAVVLGGATAFGLLAARWSDPLDLVVLGIYIGALIVLLATDLDQKLLPDLITFPLMGYALLVMLLGLNPILADKDPIVIAGFTGPAGFVTALLAAVVAPGLLALSDRIFKGSLGMGDLKLAVSLGLMFGLLQLFVGFLFGTVAFAAVVSVLVLTRRISMKTAVPFGPALIAAGVLATVL